MGRETITMKVAHLEPEGAIRCRNVDLPVDFELSEEEEKRNIKVQKQKKDEMKRQAHQEHKRKIIPSEPMTDEVVTTCILRLPLGGTLTRRLRATESLQMLCDVYEAHSGDTFHEYRLLSPYPRKIWTQEELAQTMEKLSLAGRRERFIIERTSTMPVEAKVQSTMDVESEDQVVEKQDNISSNEWTEAYETLMASLDEVTNGFYFV